MQADRPLAIDTITVEKTFRFVRAVWKLRQRAAELARRGCNRTAERRDENVTAEPVAQFGDALASQHQYADLAVEIAEAAVVAAANWH